MEFRNELGRTFLNLLLHGFTIQRQQASGIDPIEDGDVIKIELSDEEIAGDQQEEALDVPENGGGRSKKRKRERRRERDRQRGRSFFVEKIKRGSREGHHSRPPSSV
ncbi:hypothetical protein IL306_013352 [Fusarium sp. DS 682]|nr:hypothetical protein IL306_013352 [Fusarium sp. DS 682]